MAKYSKTNGKQLRSWLDCISSGKVRQLETEEVQELADFLDQCSGFFQSQEICYFLNQKSAFCHEIIHGRKERFSDGEGELPKKRNLMGSISVPELEQSVAMTIDSKCPEKWLFVDLETMDIWEYKGDNFKMATEEKMSLLAKMLKANKNA